MPLQTPHSFPLPLRIRKPGWSCPEGSRGPREWTLQSQVQGVPRCTVPGFCLLQTSPPPGKPGAEHCGDVPSHLSGTELGEIPVPMAAGILAVGSSGFPNLAPQGLEFPFLPGKSIFSSFGVSLKHSCLSLWHSLLSCPADPQGGAKPWRIPLDALAPALDCCA